MSGDLGLALRRVDHYLGAAIADSDLRASVFLLRLARHLLAQAGRRAPSGGAGRLDLDGPTPGPGG